MNMMFSLVLLKEYYFIFSIFMVFFFCVSLGLSRVHNLHSVHRQLVCSISVSFVYYLALLYCTRYGEQTLFFNMAISNVVTLYLHFLIVLLSLLVVIISSTSLVITKMYTFEFYLLFMSVVLGLLFLTSFVDFIGIYLGIELVSMCFYLLTTFNKHNLYSNEAALKYFILGTISSNFILFGFSFVYISTGLTNLFSISRLISCYVSSVAQSINLLEGNIVLTYIVVGFFFILVGLFFKMYVAPFHLWIPDIYQGAPILVAMIFNVLPLLPFMNLVLRLVMVLNVLSPIWSYFFLFFSLSSIVLGTIFSLFQSKLRRLLAYSAVTHIGYFFIFVYLFLCSNYLDVYLLQLLFVYLVIYVLTNVGVFSLVVNMYMFSGFRSVAMDELFNFSRLYKTNSFLSLVFIVFFFSMAGLPPLPGFIGKLFLFTSIFHSGGKLPLFLVVLAMAVLSGFYYLRIIKIIYFGSSSKWLFCYPMSYTNSVVASVILLILLHVFFFSEILTLPCMYLSLNYLS